MNKHIKSELILIPEEMRPVIDGEGPFIEFDQMEIVKLIPEKGDPYFLLKYFVTRSKQILACINIWGKKGQMGQWVLKPTSSNIFMIKEPSPAFVDFVHKLLDKYNELTL